MRIHTRSLLFALTFALMALGFHGGAEAKVKVGETQQYAVSLAASEGETSTVIHRDGATFIKVHFQEVALQGADTLQIFDGAGALRSTYDSSHNGSLWALSVDGDTATIVLKASAGSASRAVIDRYGYGFSEEEIEAAAELAPESTCGSDDKIDRECHPGTYRWQAANSVGRMRFEDDGGGFFVCTGSLISYQSHFLTNNHCIDSQSEASSLEVRFNYEYTSCGGSTLKSYDTYSGSTLVWTSSGLDATLLTINGSPASTYGYLPLSGRVLKENDQIYIPQHPGGNPKKIAARNDGVLWATVPTPVTSESGYTASSSFLHNADTVGGSSGSPVLDTQNYIIGLHHTGYASSPYSCTNLHPAHPTGDPADGYNGAILMSKILPNIAGYLPADILQNAQGSCSGCSGWVWARVKQTWRYTSGAQERVWADFTASPPSTVWTDAKADRLRTEVIQAAADSGHWIGMYWVSDTAFSNVRLWYN